MVWRKDYKKKKAVVKAKVKKFYKKRDTPAVPRTLSLSAGFPALLKVKHRFVQDFDLTSTLGAISNVFISANGMYSPNYTIGGTHQPYLFDQIGAVYNHYTVIAAKCWLSVTPRSVDEAMDVILSLNDDTTMTPTDTQTIREMRGSTYVCQPYGATDTKIISKGFSLKRSFGKMVNLANSELRGSVSSNPAEQQWFVISGKSRDGTSSSVQHCTATIEYIAIWSELKDIAGS